MVNKVVRFHSLSMILLVATIVCFDSFAWSASIRFKAECRCQGSLVRLGDIAEIEADNEQQKAKLSQIELFPAPSLRGFRTIRSQEIKDLLSLKSIDLTSIRFSGARRVKIYGSKARSLTLSNSKREALRLPSQVKQAEARVRQLVVDFLKQHVDPQIPWDVRLTLSHSQSRKIMALVGEIKISGGRSPWVGKQYFLLHTNQSSREQRLLVRCEIAHAKLIAVATRRLSKGEFLSAGDIVMQPLAKGVRLAGFVKDRHAIVGMKTTRSIEAGMPIESRHLQAPTLVKRGEVVTVYVRAPGLEIISTGKVSSNGQLHSVVEVQSLEDRKTRYFARVVGVQEVEVLVPGVPLKRTSATRSSLNNPLRTLDRLTK